MVEAVFEQLDLKKEVFAKLSEVCDSSTILSSNTSALDINTIAAVVPHPENVIGMHFYAPANIMKLLEVVIGELRHDVTSTQTALRDNLTILEEQVRNCKRILDKFMANAQDSGAASLQPIDELMEEVLDEWQLLRPTAQYHYHSNGVQPPTRISVDLTLRAALMNLLNNAADASPQPIDIHSRWDSSSFMLEIRDHGKGLSDEAALKAGTAFFTTKKGGRGLGLFLANATIERMGGSVHLLNREEGGATTVLALPIAGAVAIRADS